MNSKWQALVPDSFKVPREIGLGNLTLSVLTVDDIDPDYEAVMSSVTHLKGIFDFFPEWPDKKMTKSGDLSNLGWHQTEFEFRTSFAYKVVDDERDYVGCVYLFPSNDEDFEVDVYTWVKKSRIELDRILFNRVQQWIKSVWPFSRVRYPGRQ